MAVTVNVAVAVVLLSVNVMVHGALPVNNAADAEMFDETVIVPKTSPEHPAPLTLKSVLAVSVDQSVFVPVKVSLGAVPTLPEVGEIERVAVATAIVVLIESVVSLTVNVPVPEPVVIVTVWDVLDELDVLT
jgi:hypothetical protein